MDHLQWFSFRFRYTIKGLFVMALLEDYLILELLFMLKRTAAGIARSAD